MLDTSFETLCEVAREVIQQAREDGARFSPDTWRSQSIHYHLAHAYQHIQKENRGDESEDHLSHAVTRLLFAIVLKREAKE